LDAKRGDKCQGVVTARKTRPLGRRELLDAYAEFDILGLVARVGVEVVGGAVVELVALAELAADDYAESKRGDSG
jgi:hypothetical protein